jgi:nickel/cobalt transporter (NiCoT) family protein
MSTRLRLMLACVVGMNLLAAASLFAARQFGAAMLAVGLVAYGLGMRHAFDADHIAAIDNVTRRLRQTGRRPVAVGFFFSLGHSTVVLLLVLGLALAFGRVHSALQSFSDWGVLVSNFFSAAILTLIGLANLAVFSRLIKNHRSSTRDGGGAQHSVGLKTLRPWLAKSWSAIDVSWKMYPVGMLFGLGFDTATEVALLAISVGAVQSGHFPIWVIMTLPLLFTSGMCLMDSLQSLVMLRVYDWAITDDNRSLRLNTVITGLSVLLALGIASIRWTDLVKLPWLQNILGGSLDVAGSSSIGLIASAIMVLFWVIAFIYHKRQRS